VAGVRGLDSSDVAYRSLANGLCQLNLAPPSNEHKWYHHAALGPFSLGHIRARSYPRADRHFVGTLIYIDVMDTLDDAMPNLDQELSTISECVEPQTRASA